MGKFDYNCLMVGYKIPEMKKIQNSIDKEDIYYGEDKTYGLTPLDECHVTILFGIHKNYEWKDLKKYLIPLNKCETKFKKISFFEQDNYDVLKYDVSCPQLCTMNKDICDNVEYTNIYTYHPHMTIAYLKKGNTEKYKNIIAKESILYPHQYTYSKINGDREIHKTIDENKIRKFIITENEYKSLINNFYIKF